MNRFLISLIIVAIFIIIFFLLGPFFVIQEGEQAVVTRFGEIIRSIPEAGLKFKTPLIDVVTIYPKRILSWDGESRLVPTKENQFIWVDTTARWRIIDPELFYASVNTLEAAYSRLDDVIESSVRTIIAQNLLQEAVRDSNVINEIQRGTDIEAADVPTDTSGSLGELAQAGLQELSSLITDTVEQEDILTGRQELSTRMLDRADDVTPDFGIELIDIVIRQIRYSDDLTTSVYDRMVSERNRIAQAYRSYGEGRKKEILGQLEREKNIILSEAFALAEEIRGQADAEAASIYTEAYSQDVSFFEFWRAIESYRKSLPTLRKIFTTDLEYFDFLYNEQGTTN